MLPRLRASPSKLGALSAGRRSRASFQHLALSTQALSTVILSGAAATRSAAAAESRDPEVPGAIKNLERHSLHVLIGLVEVPESLSLGSLTRGPSTAFAVASLPQTSLKMTV